MNEDFVSFDLAKKLNKKGFPKYTEKSYFVGDHQKRMCSVGTFLHVHTQNTEHLIAAPTISQVLKWLREEKKIHVASGYAAFSKWRYVIMFIDERASTEPTVSCKGKESYEEAVLAGIEYVLDNLI